MRKKSKKRNKKQHREAAVHTFSQFVEQVNGSVIGRSPSILPVMEGLLKEASPLSYGNEFRNKSLDINETNHQWTDKTSFAEGHKSAKEILVSEIQALRDKYSRSISIPWYAIPLSVSPILILTILMLQSNAFKPGTVDSIQPKTHLASDSQFEREMESGAISERLGDEEGAIDCYGRAAPLPHINKHDIDYLHSAVDGIENKMPANPRVQIALGRYFETSEEFKAAEKAYRKAIELSPEHHNWIASNLLDSVLKRTSSQKHESK